MADFIEDPEILLNITEGGDCPFCLAEKSLQACTDGAKNLRCRQCGKLLKLDPQGDD